MMKCFCPITGCENILPRTLPVRRRTRSLEKVRVEFTVILKENVCSSLALHRCFSKYRVGPTGQVGWDKQEEIFKVQVMMAHLHFLISVWTLCCLMLLILGHYKIWRYFMLQVPTEIENPHLEQERNDQKCLRTTALQQHNDWLSPR